ncbi:MAG: peptidylprolyl isomerase [Candidatus Moranbacteria bacterium]|jgi:hypothetical protein|nr:peptidylprolyl isomerase [Candidatus Moranbacteria bacterium]MDX9855352.1 peptidylprolyl isomerase [Candidatus Moranbacteria bacterium]
MADKKEKKEIKNIKLSTILIGVAVFISILMIISSVIVYGFGDRVSFSKNISSVFPMPAIIIDKTIIITTKEINSNLNSIERFYESQDFSSIGLRVDFKTEEGRKRLKIREKELINKMIEDRVIEKIAKEKGIFISNKLVDESVSRKISEYGGESAIKDNLKNLYGWSLDDFKKKVVRPGLYKEELEKWFAEDEKREENEAAKKMAEESLESLSSGKGFAEVAKEKSLGSNAKSGGYLGWFREEYIADELIPAVSSLEEGKISKVIESRQGYHIVKLEGKKTDEDGAALFGISQIYFPKASFADWISEEIKRVNVNILISGYDWESRTGMAVFSDKEMEKFEERVLKENIEDVSLLSI